MESVAKLREWGSSIGLVIPKEIVRQESLKSGDEVVVEIKKAKTLKDLFGSLKSLKIDTQEFKDERRKEDKKRDEILLRQLRDN